MVIDAISKAKAEFMKDSVLEPQYIHLTAKQIDQLTTELYSISNHMGETFDRKIDGLIIQEIPEHGLNAFYITATKGLYWELEK